MKKMFIIGFSIMILGLLFAGFGFAHGGNQGIYWDNGFKAVDSKAQGRHYRQRSFSNINQIDLTADDDISIRRGNVSKVTVRYLNGNQVNKVDGKLTISGASHHRHFSWIIGGFEDDYNNDSPISVTIPEKAKLASLTGNPEDSVEVEGLTINKVDLTGEADVSMTDTNIKKSFNLQNDGDVTLRGVKAPALLQSSDDGDVTITESTFNKGQSSLSTDDGDVTLSSNTFDSVKTNTSDGDMTFRNQLINKRFEASTDDGDISGHINREKPIRVIAQGDDSDVTLFGRSRRSYGIDNVKGVQYRFDTNDGDITVE